MTSSAQALMTQMKKHPMLSRQCSFLYVLLLCSWYYVWFLALVGHCFIQLQLCTVKAVLSLFSETLFWFNGS